jgi:hypothetical protein
MSITNILSSSLSLSLSLSLNKQKQNNLLLAPPNRKSIGPYEFAAPPKDATRPSVVNITYPCVNVNEGTTTMQTDIIPILFKRRAMQELKSYEKKQFLDAAAVMYTLSTVDGRKKYGDKVSSSGR